MNRHRPRSGVAVAAAVAAVLAGAVLAACGSGAAPAPAPVSATATASAAPTAGPTAPATTGATRVETTPVATPAPGRGSVTDRAAAETTFRTYLRAVADGDFATACELNAPETTQRLLDELARRGTPAPNCEKAIATLYAGSGVAQGAAAIADTLDVQRVDVDGDTATVAWSVEVSGRRPVVTNALRRVDGRWRLLPTPTPTG